jgi:hypothetical protein
MSGKAPGFALLYVNSAANWRQSVPPIAGDDGDVVRGGKRLVERLITGIEPQERRALQLGRRGNDGQPVQTDPTHDCRANLEIATAKNKALRANWAENQLRNRMTRKKFKNCLLIEIVPDYPAVKECIYAQKSLFHTKVLRNGLNCAAWAE